MKLLKMKAKMLIPVLVTAAVFLGFTGLASHSTAAYAQDNPLGDIPVIGDLMGGGENQSQQNQSQQNQSQQNQSQQNQSQQNQSGNPLSDVPVIGELVP
jgi:hypothetical protein